MVRKTAQDDRSQTGPQSLFHGNVRQDGVLLRDGRQFFEELGEEDGGEDFGLIHGDGLGFGFMRGSLRGPAFICKRDKSQGWLMTERGGVTLG